MADPYDDEDPGNTPANPTAPPPEWWDQIQVDKWYADELGRPHTGHEHYTAGSMPNVYAAIHNSPEAAAWKARAQQGDKTEPANPTPPAEPQSPYSGGGGSGQLDSMIQALMSQVQQQMGWQNEDHAAKAEWAKFMKENLQKRMTEAQTPVDLNDPLIARQMQAGNANNQRTLQMSREAMAARQAAGGGATTGAQDAAVQSGTENLGIKLNDMMLRTRADQVDKRRDMLTSSLSQGAGILSSEEAANAQTEATNLDALSSSLRSKLANQQHYDDMAYTASHDNAVLNYLYAQLAGAGGQ